MGQNEDEGVVELESALLELEASGTRAVPPPLPRSTAGAPGDKRATLARPPSEPVPAREAARHAASDEATDSAWFSDDERPVDAGPPLARGSLAKVAQPTAASEDRLGREAEALAHSFPTRAALLQAFRARLAADLSNDLPTAERLCARAAELCPDTRFVAFTRRWIAGRKGNASELVAATMAELPLAGDAAERIALLWQIAMTNVVDREGMLRQILELDAHDLGAWLALAGSAMQEGNPAVAAEAWEAIAARTEDPCARAAFYVSAAGVREAGLSDHEGARSALDRAVEADPTSTTAIADLQSIHLRARSVADHARLVAFEADRIGDLDPGLGHHERAGDLYWEGLHDGNAASRSYERAAAVSKVAVVPLGKLVSIYEQEARHDQLASAYERLVASMRDPLRRGAVLLRLGTLYEARLDRPDDAVRCYRAALEAAPTLAPAAQALARLYEARGQWAEVATLLVPEVDRLTDPSLRAARYVAIAELLTTHLGPSSTALALYERALALDPNQVAAQEALEQLHRAAGDWGKLIALYEAQLTTAFHPARVRALRLALAALYQDRAGDPAKAADLLRAVLASPPDSYSTLTALARALAESENWAEHVDVLEEQARIFGDPGESLTRGDPGESLTRGDRKSATGADGPDLIATLYRIATVIEHRLDDPTRALSAYSRVLALDPRHEPAVQATLRIHLAGSRWADVLASERKLLELTERPEEAALILHRIAHIWEEHLARPDEAITAYEMALRHLPTYRPARVALERLLRRSGEFDRLAGLLLDQATEATSATDRARLLCHAAVVREQHLSASDAAELYSQALAIDPKLPSALWGLQRIRTEAGDWKGVADALECLAHCAEHPKTHARLTVQLARIQELRGGDLARAAELYQDALAADPMPSFVFERLRLALAVTDEGSLRWHDEAARATTDPHLASGLLRLRAASCAPGEVADDAYAAALAHGETPQVLEGLTHHRRGAALAEALALRAAQLKDGSTRALLYAVAGALHERPDAAELAYREALAAQPDFLPAFDGRRRIAEAAGDWSAAATICVDAARIAQHPDNKIELLEAAATTCADRLNDRRGAAALYREILVIAPGQRAALGRALELYELEGEWTEAAKLIAEQAPLLDDGMRAGLLACRARIVSEHLGDVDGAIADLERAVALRPGTADMLAMLAGLHEAQRHWADAAQVYDQLARIGEPQERCAALLAQARIWTSEVPDHARARQLLEQARSLDPSDRAIAVRLAEAATGAGDDQRATELYQELSRKGSAAERVAALLALVGSQRSQGIADTVATARAFRIALEDPTVIPVLEQHYRAHDDIARYVADAEAVLAHALPTTETAPLRLSVGTILGGELSAPERAIPYLRAAVLAEPTDVRLRITLAEALATRDDASAIGELRRVIETDPTEPHAYRQLAEICARQGRELAASLLGTAAALLGDDDAAAQGLRSVPALAAPVANALPPDDALAIFVGQTGVPDVRRVVAELDPYLHLIFPQAQDTLGALDPVPERDTRAIAIRAIANALAIPSLEVYWGECAQPMLLASDPRAIVLDPDRVVEPATSQLRFDAAFAIARLAGGSVVGQTIPTSEVQVLLRAITDRDRDNNVWRRTVQPLSRRARKELERALDEIGIVIEPSATAAWEREESQRALCVGVVASCDLRAVARSLCPSAVVAGRDQRRAKIRACGRVVDALRFAASDVCWKVTARFYGRP